MLGELIRGVRKPTNRYSITGLSNGSYRLTLKAGYNLFDYEGDLNVEHFLKFFNTTFLKIVPRNVSLREEGSTFIKIIHPISILYGALSNIFCVWESNIPIKDKKMFKIANCFLPVDLTAYTHLINSSVKEPIISPNERYRRGVYVLYSKMKIDIVLKELPTRKFHEIHGKHINVPGETLC